MESWRKFSTPSFPILIKEISEEVQNLYSESEKSFLELSLK